MSIELKHGEPSKEEAIAELARLFALCNIGDYGKTPWETVSEFDTLMNVGSLFLSLHRLLEMNNRPTKSQEADSIIALWVIAYGHDGPLGESLKKNRY